MMPVGVEVRVPSSVVVPDGGLTTVSSVHPEIIRNVANTKTKGTKKNLFMMAFLSSKVFTFYLLKLTPNPFSEICKNLYNTIPESAQR